LHEGPDLILGKKRNDCPSLFFSSGDVDVDVDVDVDESGYSVMSEKGH